MSNTSIKNVNNFTYITHYSYDYSELRFKTIISIPFIQYPNGLPCFEGNAYILHLLQKGLSDLNGGTLKSYAKCISYLINYLFKKNIKLLSDLNNNHFTDFILDLRYNKESSSNRIIYIGSRCISFLFFLQDLYSLNNFIGTSSSCSIRVISKPLSSRNKFRIDSTFSHLSFPNRTPQLKRELLKSETILKLRQYFSKFDDQSLRIRNLCILDLLQFSGVRLTELTSLKIQDIQFAAKDPEHKIRFHTLKKMNKTSRVIPVPPNLISSINHYIKFYRNPIIQSKSNIEKHDYIFISHTTGNPLKSSSITTFFHQWSSELNIHVFPHLFRHYFITNKFKSLINEYNISNSGEFRNQILSIEKIKLQLLEWTGHSSIESLDIYIHLAFLNSPELIQSVNQSQEVDNLEYLLIKLLNLQNSSFKLDNDLDEAINLTKSLLSAKK